MDKEKIKIHILKMLDMMSEKELEEIYEIVHYHFVIKKDH